MLDSAHVVAVLVPFALTDQAPRRSGQPSRQLGRVSRQPKEHRRCGRAQGHRRAHVNWRQVTVRVHFRGLRSVLGFHWLRWFRQIASRLKQIESLRQAVW